MIFPEKFTTTEVINFNAHYRTRLIGILNYVISEDKKDLERVQKTDEFFTELIKPKKLDSNDTNNIIYQNRRQFEMLCVSLLNSGIASPEKMTVLRFFTTLKFYEKKNKQKPNNSRR